MLINAKVGVKNENVPPFYRSEILVLNRFFVEIMATSGAIESYTVYVRSNPCKSGNRLPNVV